MLSFLKRKTAIYELLICNDETVPYVLSKEVNNALIMNVKHCFCKLTEYVNCVYSFM